MSDISMELKNLHQAGFLWWIKP